jgi:2-oxoglutarate ferredoxin oxidoreductase subunit beta
MVTTEDYGTYETAWCPGCGNFLILKAVKDALASLELQPHEVLFVAGIGQAAKAPHYFNCNLFNGLHGRALPVATGAGLANPELKIIVQSGDGCTYGEGGNHFSAAVRRNADVTVLVHNNHVYGLTKGQVSPTSTKGEGFITRPQPEGSFVRPFNPLLTAIVQGAGFVARGFTGDIQQLSELMQRGINHEGFALVDILQPCVSFNETDIFKWYKERCYTISDDHDTSDRYAAMKLAEEWGDRIPLGVLYEATDLPSFEARYAALADGPLALQDTSMSAFREILDSYT